MSAYSVADVFAVLERVCREVDERYCFRVEADVIDHRQQDVHVVRGSLLARQCQLWRGMATASSVWNRYHGSLLVRSMIEVLINMAWIGCEPIDRAELFINHGIGQAHLQLEHHRVGTARTTASEGDLNQATEWLNRQMHEMFIDINTGSWSGLGLAKMAEESGCAGMAILFHVFSGPIHSMWPFLSEFCVTLKDSFYETMHLELEPELDLLFLCTYLLDRTFAVFDGQARIESSGEESLTKLLGDLLQ